MDRQNSDQERFHFLLQNEIPTTMPPELRLLTAILRQAVLDYFQGDPLERYGAWQYFAESPIYRLTLRACGLPDDLLPAGVEVEQGYRRKEMDEVLGPMDLKTFVRELSGAQLKVLLAMGGMLPLASSAGMVANACGLNRTTAAVALEQMSKLGLVVMEMDGSVKTWLLSDDVRTILQEVWGLGGDAAATDES